MFNRSWVRIQVFGQTETFTRSLLVTSKKVFTISIPCSGFEEKNSGDPKFGSPYCDENRKKIHNFLPLSFLPRKGGNIF